MAIIFARFLQTRITSTLYRQRHLLKRIRRTSHDTMHNAQEQTKVEIIFNFSSRLKKSILKNHFFKQITASIYIVGISKFGGTQTDICFISHRITSDSTFFSSPLKSPRVVPFERKLNSA